MIIRKLIQQQYARAYTQTSCSAAICKESLLAISRKDNAIFKKYMSRQALFACRGNSSFKAQSLPAVFIHFRNWPENSARGSRRKEYGSFLE